MSDLQPVIDPKLEEYWRNFFMYGYAPKEERFRSIFRRLPADPRCKLCAAPFKGFGASVVRIFFQKHQSKVNPQMCDTCEKQIEKHMGGAEIEMTMLFADVRGSTSLAEQMSISAFRTLIERFFQVSTAALYDTGALFIDKLGGDEVAGGFVPGIAGPNHAVRAVEAAQKILQATGHSNPTGPWIPVGVGVHTGIAYLGAVGTRGGVIDFNALGDAPNTAARLSSNAAAGEILVSEEAWTQSPHEIHEVEQRHLQVKGRRQPVHVHVVKVLPGTG